MEMARRGKWGYIIGLNGWQLKPYSSLADGVARPTKDWMSSYPDNLAGYVLASAKLIVLIRAS